jgi:hypothetical protein
LTLSFHLLVKIVELESIYSLLWAFISLSSWMIYSFSCYDSTLETYHFPLTLVRYNRDFLLTKIGMPKHHYDIWHLSYVDTSTTTNALQYTNKFINNKKYNTRKETRGA